MTEEKWEVLGKGQMTKVSGNPGELGGKEGASQQNWLQEKKGGIWQSRAEQTAESISPETG